MSGKDPTPDAEELDDGFDAPEPARLLASGHRPPATPPPRNAAFASLQDNLGIGLDEDPDTEETPPTAVPGDFDFRFDWHEEGDEPVGPSEDTFDGAALDDIDPAFNDTFDGSEFDEDEDEDEGDSAEEDDAPVVQADVADQPHAVAYDEEVPAWMIAVAFFVLGLLVGEFLLP